MQRMGKMNLTDDERDKLLTATRSRTARVADVRRAKLILMLEEGQSRDTIMQRLECDSRFISRCSSRFLTAPLAPIFPPPLVQPLSQRAPGGHVRPASGTRAQAAAGQTGGAGAQLHAQAQAERWLH